LNDKVKVRRRAGSTPGAYTPAVSTAALAPASTGRARVSLPLVLAVVAVGMQIAYPLLDGAALRRLTVLTVVVFAAAGLAHAARTRGPAAALLVLAVAGGTSLVAEAVGVATGYPFGRYLYAGTLGPSLLGVPVLVPLAWTMMAYPLLLAARTACASRPRAVVPAGALALVGWDLYLDAQMVDAGHWTWTYPDPHLPGLEGVPLTNYVGWALVSTLLMAALHRTLPAARDGVDAAATPALLVGWTWLGSAVALAFFLDRPGAAGWGLLVMAPVTVPALRSWLGRGKAGARR